MHASGVMPSQCLRSVVHLLKTAMQGSAGPSNTAAAGLPKLGAAMVMGHSEQQWHNWYDLQFHPRLAQNAVTVNSMQQGLQCCRSGQIHLLLQQSSAQAQPEILGSVKFYARL